MTTQIFIEFPNFGFGPARSAITAINCLKDERCTNLVSSGVALEFVSREFPLLTTHDVNTMNPAAYNTFESIAPTGSILLSNTNPDFANWAAAKGYQVVVIDILDWMWDDSVPTVPGAEAYISQFYFGPYRRGFIAPGRQLVQPILDIRKRAPNRKPSLRSEALIACGGMGNPFSQTLEAIYVRKLLPSIVESLKMVGGLERIHLVGGLLANDWNYSSPSVVFHGSLEVDSYLELLLNCKYVFLTPGLNSIYECILLGVYPFFLPGSNVSQILQAHDLSTTTEYPYIAPWPEQGSIARVLGTMTEPEGIAYVEESVFAHLDLLGASKRLWFDELLTRYLAVASENVMNPQGQKYFAKVRAELDRYPELCEILNNIELFAAS